MCCGEYLPLALLADNVLKIYLVLTIYIVHEVPSFIVNCIKSLNIVFTDVNTLTYIADPWFVSLLISSLFSAFYNVDTIN